MFFPLRFKKGIARLTGTQHPHLSPAETWKSLFKPTPDNLDPNEAAELHKVKEAHSLFTPSLKPAHEEMLRILREEEEGTITIVAVGPLTNLAIAAAADPETFLRVKEVVVMGGAVDAPGNVSPIYFSSIVLFYLHKFPTLFPLVLHGTRSVSELSAATKPRSSRLSRHNFPPRPQLQPH